MLTVYVINMASDQQSKWKSLSCIRLFATPWTVACQAPLSMEFSRPEYRSGLPFPSLEGSSQPRDQTQVSRVAGRFFTVWATRECCKDISIINEIYCGYTASSWKYSYLCIFFNLHIYILIVWHTGRDLEYRVTWVRIPSNPAPEDKHSRFSTGWKQNSTSSA